MTWRAAVLKALLIVIYFAFATVWLPNAIINLTSIAEASSFVRETVVLLVWGVGLLGGLIGLSQAHKRGII